MIKQSWKKLNTITSTIIISLLLSINPVKADSPLTSTDLTAGYERLPIIIKLQKTRAIDNQVLEFLLSNASLDKKAAVINALGWNINGQKNGHLFIEALLKKKQIKSIEQLRLRDLTPEDKFVVGYLLAMDDYFKLSSLQPSSRQSVLATTPLEFLSQAAFALPNNFTVHFVKSLVEAQLYFNNSWCAVYLSPLEVLQRFPANKRNLHPSAVAKSIDYINLYRENCFGFE